MAEFGKQSFIDGVCPLIYRKNEPTSVLVVQELTAKELTGKLKGQWGPGFETVESGETHRDAIDRFFEEEVRFGRGKVFIPEDLEQAKLCTVRLSPLNFSPEAWVHVYPTPVSDDFEAAPGSFVDEVSTPVWIDGRRVLSTQGEGRKMLFRTGTYEILRKHLERVENPQLLVFERILHPDAMPPSAVYRLMGDGLSQIEALSQLLGNPPRLEESLDLIRQVYTLQLAKDSL